MACQLRYGLLWAMWFLRGVWSEPRPANMNASVIAYDCTDKSATHAVVDLTSLEPCETPQSMRIQEEQVYVTVLQTRLYRPVTVSTCLVEYSRSIVRCGMHSHISALPAGVASQMVELGPARCRALHDTRAYKTGNALLEGLQLGRNIRVVTVAGSVGENGDCTGGTYSDSLGSYHNALVQAQYTITLHVLEATATLLDDKIIISRAGLRCGLQSEYCRDDEFGEAVWTYRDKADCTNTVDTLYSGSGIITKADDGTSILVVKSGPSTFALRMTGLATLCGFVVYGTEHSRIFISKRSDLSPKWPSEGTLYGKNVDLSLHIGSKFLFVTHMSYTNLLGLAKDFLVRECELRRMIMEDRLLLARLSPTGVSQITEGPGMYGRVQGEVLYIIKCQPVLVQLRYTDLCYQELPVAYNGRKVFRSQTSHMIVPDGTEVPCKNLMHPRFKLYNKWYIRTPELVPVQDPVRMNPNTNRTWFYEPLVGVGVGGLYSESQLDALQKEMMFPSVRDAISNNMIRKVTGTGGDSFDPSRMWSTKQLEDFSSSVAGKISWFFSVFGHYASIIIGLYLFYRVGIYVLGVCVNAYILRANGGRGCGLIYSLVDSCTMLRTFLHPSEKLTQNKLKDAAEEPKPVVLAIGTNEGEIMLRGPYQDAADSLASRS